MEESLCPFLLNTRKSQFLFNFFAVVLLDTTGEATLDWTRYPYGPQANTPGVSFFSKNPK